MLSYKEYKQINESVLGTRTLGMSQPQSLGIISDMPTEEELLAEMKKKMAETKNKMKKKMLGDVDQEGGEMVKPAEPKDADKDAEKIAAKDSEDTEEKDDHDEEDEDTDHEDKESEKEEEKEHEDDDSGAAKEMFMKKGGKKDKKEDKKEDKKDKEECCKKCGLKDCTCKCNKMKKEDQEFWNSLHNMAGMPETKNWDGWTPITSVTQGIRQ